MCNLIIYLTKNISQIAHHNSSTKTSLYESYYHIIHLKSSFLLERTTFHFDKKFRNEIKGCTSFYEEVFYTINLPTNFNF